MDNSELLMLLDSDVELKVRVAEAMRVLEGKASSPAPVQPPALAAAARQGPA